MSADGWRSYAWQFGPVWTVAIALRDHGGQGITVQALIDTGASSTCAVRSVFKRLGATPIDAPRVRSHGSNIDHPVEVEQYLVDLAMPYTTSGACVVRGCFVTEIMLSGDATRRPYDFIVGNDVLTRCLLTLDGPRQRFRLEPGDPA